MTRSSKPTRYTQIKPKERLPEWIQPSIGKASQLENVQNLVKKYRLHTICEEGRCPNRGECYASGTATFLLGGSICTRSCAFCQVEKGLSPERIDPHEPDRIAQVVFHLKLKYVVLTSVARDDLSDHGAILFTKTIDAIRKLSPKISIEVLTPDFWGGYVDELKAVEAQRHRLKTVLKAKPVCLNHNIETVERLQKEVRRGATYKRSLDLLRTSSEIDKNIPTKSGLMLGLGETREEIIKVLKDLRSVNCQHVTIGQYLRPSLSHLPVQRYWHPQEFLNLEIIAKGLGFSKVNSGPLVRSSYHADQG
ncbi:MULTISPECIES: lipoyl synthase [unclassified Prochlorococcus]|uniref:lipoyl synthase n=1 Tax=unclassified Prochlorococcus TaxID=2627481 RepID=UPI000533A683|nr:MULTISPECIES: lipoyl synthase [unclassified Prochlorococcus]KGG15424.1 Lipoate synthase [Prochlorococcus sp. MIT 0602]KGG17702.1 Lipoate synthase [Prochlorococcus sp. MIT 0603]